MGKIRQIHVNLCVPCCVALSYTQNIYSLQKPGVHLVAEFAWVRGGAYHGEAVGSEKGPNQGIHVEMRDLHIGQTSGERSEKQPLLQHTVQW